MGRWALAIPYQGSLRVGYTLYTPLPQHSTRALYLKVWHTLGTEQLVCFVFASRLSAASASADTSPV